MKSINILWAIKTNASALSDAKDIDEAQIYIDILQALFYKLDNAVMEETKKSESSNVYTNSEKMSSTANIPEDVPF